MSSPPFTLEPIAQAICQALGYSFGGGKSQGSFKETFLVTKKDNSKLALKVLRPGCSTERSDREVDAMKRCQHANIVGLIELAQFDHGGTKYVYLLEQFMEGGTLEERLKKGLLSRDEILSLGEELLGALAHIAEKELVHRDFKPANILYAVQGGQAFVCDFGIVRDLQKKSLTHSFLVAGPGTPYFAAPEQLNNEKSLIDWRTDQFAVGVTLAVAYLGYHPYHVDGEDVNKAIGRVMSRSGPADRFSKATEEARLPVLQKMVARWPAERFRLPNTLLEEWSKQREP